MCVMIIIMGVSCCQGNLPPPTDMSEHIKDYLFDSVLMQILKTYGPWLTKVGVVSTKWVWSHLNSILKKTKQAMTLVLTMKLSDV